MLEKCTLDGQDTNRNCCHRSYRDNLYGLAWLHVWTSDLLYSRLLQIINVRISSWLLQANKPVTGREFQATQG